jgi:hypothetical protein
MVPYPRDTHRRFGFIRDPTQFRFRAKAAHRHKVDLSLDFR